MVACRHVLLYPRNMHSDDDVAGEKTEQETNRRWSHCAHRCHRDKVTVCPKADLRLAWNIWFLFDGTARMVYESTTRCQNGCGSRDHVCRVTNCWQQCRRCRYCRREQLQSTLCAAGDGCASQPKDECRLRHSTWRQQTSLGWHSRSNGEIWNN